MHELGDGVLVEVDIDRPVEALVGVPLRLLRLAIQLAQVVTRFFVAPVVGDIERDLDAFDVQRTVLALGHGSLLPGTVLSKNETCFSFSPDLTSVK